MSNIGGWREVRCARRRRRGAEWGADRGAEWGRGEGGRTDDNVTMKWKKLGLRNDESNCRLRDACEFQCDLYGGSGAAPIILFMMFDEGESIA